MKENSPQMKAAGFRIYQGCFHGVIHFHKSMLLLRASEREREREIASEGSPETKPHLLESC
jgi:hypothetical protein